MKFPSAKETPILTTLARFPFGAYFSQISPNRHNQIFVLRLVDKGWVKVTKTERPRRYALTENGIRLAELIRNLEQMETLNASNIPPGLRGRV